MTMKKLCALLALTVLLCAVLCPAGADPEEEAEKTGSWSQINQSLARKEGWQRFVEDPSAFRLGEITPRDDNAELFDGAWGTYPSLDGSTVCVPLAMELARQWLDLDEEDLNGFVSFSTTPYAYDRLTNLLPNPTVVITSKGITMDSEHPVDLVLGTGPNADERKAAEDAGAELVMVPVCYDAFVFLVNGENPVTGLTSEQIRSIYTGVTRIWSDVGGEAGQPIIAYQRPHGSGSQTAMEELVMQGMNLSAAEQNFIADGMGDLIRQVGNYTNSRQALGYSYLYYVDQLYRDGSIRVLSVDGAEPSPENLRSGAYPYTVYYYAVYRAENENAKAFADWLVSDEGQKCVAQAGYIPLRDIAENE